MIDGRQVPARLGCRQVQLDHRRAVGEDRRDAVARFETHAAQAVDLAIRGGKQLPRGTLPSAGLDEFQMSRIFLREIPDAKLRLLISLRSSDCRRRISEDR